MDNRACNKLPYIIDLEPLTRVKPGPKVVLLQLPPGMRQYANTVAECIEEILGSKIIVQLDPVYGGCDLFYPQARELLDADLIVHIGHTPYPTDISSPKSMPRGVRTIFLPALSKTNPTTSQIKVAAEILRSYGAGRPVVVSTAQHVHMLQDVMRALEGLGLKPVVPKGVEPYFLDGQILGCDYRLARSVRDADSYIYVGGGLFHPLGLYLATQKPTVQVDPYTGRTEDITPIGERTLKVRMYKVMKAMDAKNWALIIGLKTGQYRPWLTSLLGKQLRMTGRKYRLYASDRLTLEDLRSLPPEHDSIVVTSCPRLPIDDLADFEKPVLTPGEAFMAIEGKLEPYRFPW